MTGANPTPINARRSTACTSDTDGRLYFFGGVGRNNTESILDVSDDMWVYDPALNRWGAIPKLPPWPLARRCTGFVGGKGTLELWGGSGIRSTPQGLTYTFLNDHWVFHTSNYTWSVVQESLNQTDGDQGNQPGERYTPCLVRTGESLFLFGGYTEDALGKRKLNDAWAFQRSQWRQVPFNGSP